MEINTDEIFVKDDLTFIINHISKEGLIIKTTLKEKIVGFLIVRFPKEAKDNLGRDASIQQNELDDVAHIESVAVVPKHRGQQIGYQMIKKADHIIKAMGLKYAMATVSPKNKYSLINFLKRDYRVVKIKKKYSGVKRLILMKKNKK